MHTWQTSLSARTRLTMARQPLHCTPPELPQCFMALTMVVTPSRSPTCARTCSTAQRFALQRAMPAPIMRYLGVEAVKITIAMEKMGTDRQSRGLAHLIIVPGNLGESLQSHNDHISIPVRVPDLA